MKNILFPLSFFITSYLYCQTASFPAINIKTVDGENFNTQNIENDGKPIVINFWATWCGPCKRELNTITDLYSDWKEETGVKIIAISIDDSRNMSKVSPYVNAQGWSYEVYVDPNGDFKRAMNVNNIPHTFVLNSKKEIVWQHNSYSPGDEDELYKVIKNVASENQKK